MRVQEPGDNDESMYTHERELLDAYRRSGGTIPTGKHCGMYDPSHINGFAGDDDDDEEEASPKVHARLDTYMHADSLMTIFRVGCRTPRRRLSGFGSASHASHCSSFGPSTLHSCAPAHDLHRYAFDGAVLPVHSSRTAQFRPPACTCGAPRVFECQLLPSLVTEARDAHGRRPLSFSNVAVYACAASCWDDAALQLREEYVLVEADPDEHVAMLKA